MKDKTLTIKVDDEFLEKIDYLQLINDFKNRSDTVRKVMEKEYQKKQVSAYQEYVTDTDCPYRKGGFCQLLQEKNYTLLCTVDWHDCGLVHRRKEKHK